MKIAIRTDASSQIGTGHFMRCLTLADGLSERGAKIRFISRHLPEHLRSMLPEKGYEFVRLNSALNDTPLDEHAHAHWLGVSQAQDAADSIRALSDGACDWIIVDHYALDLHEHHSDPQDRIINASAIEHNAKLMSDDSKFVKYAELEGRLL